MTITLPEYISATIKRLEAHGYEAFAVGGCVRDSLLGRAPSDWDITTSARPETVSEIFSGEDFKVIPTGILHGTVTVIVDNKPIEITTYRVDGSYSDSRRPDEVSFTSSIDEDLARRDFTINAMAYSPLVGLVDLYGGQADLENKQIRAVGDAKTRFDEDALRIMRALRFASTLGFSIESGTASAAISLAERLTQISKERITAELEKTLSGSLAAKLLDEFYPVFKVILPELSQNSGARLSALKSLDASPSFALMLAAIIEGDIENTLSMLRLDKRTARLARLIFGHRTRAVRDKRDALGLCSLVGVEAARYIILLGIAGGTNGINASRYVDEIIEGGECYSVKMLAVGGDDLIALGARAEDIGKILDSLLEAVISGQVKNDKESLLGNAKKALKG